MEAIFYSKTRVTGGINIRAKSVFAYSMCERRLSEWGREAMVSSIFDLSILFLFFSFIYDFSWGRLGMRRNFSKSR